MEEPTLKISEMFYSIQGEGVHRGIPSIFVRISGCNMMCGGHNSELVQKKQASWYCDSEKIWKKGTEYNYDQFKKFLIDINQWENILKGTTHLIWTGGEPTIPRSAKIIEDFIKTIATESIGEYGIDKSFHELETNGSLNSNLYECVNHINCSPKLSNSGMPEELRINKEVLQLINYYEGSFKFVITSKEDWEEIERDFLTYIDKKNIILMPGLDNFNDVVKTGQMVWNLAQDLNLRMTLRDHIVVWNKTIGV